MPKIENLIARQIIDSRATPTVEADILFEDGSFGRASVPSGASTGEYEAKEIRDGDPDEFDGLGVKQAIASIEGEIRKQLIGKEFSQEELDQELIALDGTEDKSRLGGNAILAVSLAFAKADAYHHATMLYEHIGTMFPEYEEMPRPMFNIINGGAHADSGLSFQEFMIVPQMESFEEEFKCGVEIYNSLKLLLKEMGYKTSVGDEGGFAPALESNEQALELIMEAGRLAGYTAGEDHWLALDIAANELKDENGYLHQGKYLNTENFLGEIAKLSKNFPIMSIEDPLSEDDEDGFFQLNKLIGEDVLIVGDDLLVTDPAKIEDAGNRKIANSVIIKPNQIGTVSETLEAIMTANSQNMVSIFAHRSGETEDTAIAHLAVASRVPLVKFGAPARGERVAKYNELFRIEKDIEIREQE
ncbi:MAG: phosphopyruvate hydratase [Candidatus Paceibacterota bacterium]